jgi:3-dehydroquinate dehydratase-1
MRSNTVHFRWNRQGPGLDTNVNLEDVNFANVNSGQMNFADEHLENILGQSTKNRFAARIIGIVTAANRMDPAMWDALALCDLAEFRADGFPPGRVIDEALSFRRESRLKLGRPIETLLTLRLQRDGGAWPDSDAALREPIWQSLGLDGGGPGGQGPGGQGPLCDWVDVEIEEFASLSQKTRGLLQSGRAQLLLSHHDFRGCPPRGELAALMARMQAHNPAGMKFAVTCGNRGELSELLAFARDLADATPHGCALSMGATGRVSRVLGPLLGCPLTYGYLTGGAVAPGQLSAGELRAFFDSLEVAGLDVAGLVDVDGLDAGAMAERRGARNMELVDWAEARIAGDTIAD